MILHVAMSLMSTRKSDGIHATIRFLVREEVMMLFALPVIFMLIQVRYRNVGKIASNNLLFIMIGRIDKSDL